MDVRTSTAEGEAMMNKYSDGSRDRRHRPTHLRRTLSGAVALCVSMIGLVGLVGAPTAYAGGSGTITTIIGNGSTGDGVPELSASLDFAEGIAVDPHGNLVVSDVGDHRVRVFAQSTGTFYGQAMTAGDTYVVAGQGTNGPNLSQPAPIAQLNYPIGVTVDSHGNIVIVDNANAEVKVVPDTSGTYYGQAMVAGDIYVVAGDGTTGFAGDGGPATSAELNAPGYVSVDGSGNLVVADGSNNRVRVVAEVSGSFYGQAMTAGDIYTVAGDGTAGFSGDGGAATSAELQTPTGVALDTNGNLVITDQANNRLRVVAASTGTFYGQAMTAGDIYTVVGNRVNGDSGDGGPATSAELGYPNTATFDANHNMVIDDTSNFQVRVVPATSGTYYGQAMTAGDIYTVAGNGTNGYSGDGGLATSAEISEPFGLTVDLHGNVIVADSGNDRVRLTAGKTATYFGVAMTKGHIYTVAGNGKSGYSGDGGRATSAKFNAPRGVATDANGNILISDNGNTRIRCVAATTGTFYGIHMTAGDVYTVAGNGTYGYSGNGVKATLSDLGSVEQGITVDSHGNIVLADSGTNRIQVVAATTGTFYGTAMTADDMYSVAGDGTAGFAGDGGKAKSAELASPTSVAVDPNGNLVVADTGNARIRVVAESTGTYYGQAMTKKHIYTVAGDGTIGYAGDGGPATSAELNFNEGLTTDSHGNIVLSDDHNNRVRVVAASTGTFYGVAVTSGDIETVAGDGTIGYAGDGGPATSAELYLPVDVAIDTHGNIDVAEGSNGRIRQVAA